MAEKATDVVYRLSQRPAERAGLTQQPMLEAITKEIKLGRHGGQVKLLAIANNISKTPAGQEGLFRAHTIPELVGMLPHSELRIVNYALSTLHTLIRHLGRSAKQAVRLCGGVERMVELFGRNMSDKQLSNFRPMLFDSLQCLAFHSVETKGIHTQNVNPQINLNEPILRHHKFTFSSNYIVYPNYSFNDQNYSLPSGILSSYEKSKNIFRPINSIIYIHYNHDSF